MPYKVLTRTEIYGEITYHSAFVHGDFQLIYKEGQITQQREGTLGIFCFETLKDAKSFMNTLGWGNCIFEVKGYGKKKKVPSLIPKKIDYFWSFYQKRVLESELSETPIGTVLYNKIKLLKKENKC